MSAQGRLRDAAGIPVPDAAGEGEGLRVGFTITKRVGHATERNRIRRRLREAVKRAAPDLPRVPADIVLVARRPALHAPFETLIADLRRSVGAVAKAGGGKPGNGKPGGAKPGGAKRPDSGRPRGRGGAATPSEATPSAPPARPHEPRASAQRETRPAATRDAAGALPPSNTRDGSLDG